MFPLLVVDAHAKRLLPPWIPLRAPLPLLGLRGDIAGAGEGFPLFGEHGLVWRTSCPIIQGSYPRKWRRLKKEEREVLAARAAEASQYDEDAKRRARAARAKRRWRELSWRHVNRVEGLGGDPGARRRRAAERKYEGRRWDQLELGWDATIE